MPSVLFVLIYSTFKTENVFMKTCFTVLEETKNMKMD